MGQILKLGCSKDEDYAKRHPLSSRGWGPAVFPQTLSQTQMAYADQILYDNFQFVANARCKVCCIIFLKYILSYNLTNNFVCMLFHLVCICTVFKNKTIDKDMSKFSFLLKNSYLCIIC